MLRSPGAVYLFVAAILLAITDAHDIAVWAAYTLGFLLEVLAIPREPADTD